MCSCSCSHFLILCSYSTYRPFHKTLPRSSLQMHWISVRFCEMGDIQIFYVVIIAYSCWSSLFRCYRIMLSSCFNSQNVRILYQFFCYCAIKKKIAPNTIFVDPLAKILYPYLNVVLSERLFIYFNG